MHDGSARRMAGRLNPHHMRSSKGPASRRSAFTTSRVTRLIKFRQQMNGQRESQRDADYAAEEHQRLPIRQ